MTLYDVLERTDKEVTVWDKDYDIEVYFYGIKDQQVPMDEWDKAKLELAKLLDVVEISWGSVEVNLAEVIERKMSEIKEADSFLTECDVGDIISILANILTGCVSDKWHAKFAEVLKGGN